LAAGVVAVRGRATVGGLLLRYVQDSCGAGCPQATGEVLNQCPTCLLESGIGLSATSSCCLAVGHGAAISVCSPTSVSA